MRSDEGIVGERERGQRIYWWRVRQRPVDRGGSCAYWQGYRGGNPWHLDGGPVVEPWLDGTYRTLAHERSTLVDESSRLAGGVPFRVVVTPWASGKARWAIDGEGQEGGRGSGVIEGGKGAWSGQSRGAGRHAGQVRRCGVRAGSAWEVAIAGEFVESGGAVWREFGEGVAGLFPLEVEPKRGPGRGVAALGSSFGGEQGA